MNRICFALASFCVFIIISRAADEPMAAVRMRALFAQADADRDGVLSSEEQAKAIEDVRTVHGASWSRKVAAMFARLGAVNEGVSAAAWKKEVEAVASPAEKRTEMVPMRDGVRLAVDIHLPRGEGPFPVVLSRTPYSRVKRAGSAGEFVRAGYAFVIQDMRGRFDSEGENLPFAGCGWEGHQDGVDTINWLKEQPWCNGVIGTNGGSAGGITQNLLAGAAPSGVKAQYISVAATSLYEDASYIGGAFRKADSETWLIGNDFAPEALAQALAHPSYDDYWAAFDTSKRFAVMDVPAVHLGGWYDIFSQGTIDQFVGRQHHGGPGARGQQKLVMGPWAHGIGQMPVGELTFPDARSVPPAYSPARWFKHFLEGEANGVADEPAVCYYVMGDTRTPGAPGNEWRQAADWPIPAKETPLYLQRGGKLSWEVSGADPAHVEYTFDPADPCPTIGGTNLTIPSGPLDQRAVERRSDVVSFTTGPLDQPVEMTGRLRAKIFVSSSAVDSDLSVRLCDVHPDGRSILIAEGMQRLRYRNSKETSELLKPGKMEEVTVDCWSTSMIFNRGHRIRVTITSSNYPRFDLNPGTGKPWTGAETAVKQINRIYCDAQHPSRLIAPVVE